MGTIALPCLKCRIFIHLGPLNLSWKERGCMTSHEETAHNSTPGWHLGQREFKAPSPILAPNPSCCWGQMQNIFKCALTWRRVNFRHRTSSIEVKYFPSLFLFSPLFATWLAAALLLLLKIVTRGVNSWVIWWSQAIREQVVIIPALNLLLSIHLCISNPVFLYSPFTKRELLCQYLMSQKVPHL